MVAGQIDQGDRLVRKIFFYRAYVGENDAGRPLAFNPRATLEEINDLGWAENYWEADSKVTCCWVDRNQPNHRLRLGIVRRNDLPQIEENGRLRPLDLPEDSGLAEQIHVVLFPNNIVGADFNFHGPRLQRLGHYLRERAPRNCPRPIAFEQLINRDAREQLRRFEDIGMLTMRIRVPFADVVHENDRDLGNAFRASIRAAGGNVGIVELTLKPSPYSRESLDRGLLRSVDRILRRHDVRENVEKLVVRGYDHIAERVSEIDLMNDKFISERQIVRMGGRGRALDPNSAYTAIEASYQGLREQLEEAAAIG